MAVLESLAQLWAKEAASGTSVNYVGFRRIFRALKRKGLDMPSEKVFLQEFRNDGGRLHFKDLLRLVWDPLAAFANHAASGSSAELTKELRLNLHHLGQEMSRYDPPGGINTDEWVARVQQDIKHFGGCNVSAKHIKAITSAIVPFKMDSSVLTAFIMLRTDAIKRLVGNTLGNMISECALDEASGLQQPQAPADLNQSVRQDLVELLERQALGAEETEGLDEADSAPPAKKSRTSESMQMTRQHKTEQLQFLLTNKVGVRRASATVKGAVELASSLCEWDLDLQALENALASRFSLTKHMLLLDGALDRLAAEDIASRREAGMFAGAVIATDESPPSQPRFAGLRFQITMVYFGVFQPIEEWEASADPPITSKMLVADIVHCSSKRGEEVADVLDKQISRFGLSRADVVGGVGDGGGENEGKSGVHASFEKENPSYVRRRCLPHLAWRVADAAINASDTEGVSIKTLAAHFADGVTWQRLRVIATKGKVDGGLSLFRDGSQACHDVFHCHPGATIDTRPQSHLRFLNLLRGNEHVLFQCASQDLGQRDLVASTGQAVAELGIIQKRIKRTILGEVLERCMFLMYHNSKHPNLALEDTWDGMSKKFTEHILDMALTDEVLKRFKTTQENLDALGWLPNSWIDLVVLMVMGDTTLVEGQLSEAFAYHKVITDKAASHLALVASNIMRTSWLAAGILSKDALQAQTGASQLVRHLATTPPALRSAFEDYMFSTTSLWQNLVDFANAKPPQRVWQGRGHFVELFKFLASRFLTAPDNVLDCERMHGRWQWQCEIKRALKMHTLNATLKLSRYLELNGGFPHIEAIAEHLEVERQELNWNIQELNDDLEIAKGWRSSLF